MAYATEAELEAILLVPTTFFGAGTPITTTMVTAILAQYSLMLDGMTGRSAGYYGSDTTCPEWVNSAVLQVAAARIEAKIVGESFTTQQAAALMEKLVGKLPSQRETDLTPSFNQNIPSSAGNFLGTSNASYDS